MLIGLCGGLCTGKHTVAEYLVKSHGFKAIHLKSPLPEKRQPEEGLAFSNAEDLLNFVINRWRERWVIPTIWDEAALDVLAIRPFFLLVSIDAPVIVRWERSKKRSSDAMQTLETFILQNDDQLYNANDGLAHLIGRAQLRLLNPSNSLNFMKKSLAALDLTNEERLRPSWDQYFMQLASLAAQRSNCMKRRVGCVIVREKRVISTGYNGTPRNLTNCNEGGCPRCNRGEGLGIGLSTCLCIHAEENALLEAGRERIREGSILYCDTCPCLTCSVKITQVGISEVVYNQSYRMDQQTITVFREAGVKFRQFSPPRNGLVDLGLDKMMSGIY